MKGRDPFGFAGPACQRLLCGLLLAMACACARQSPATLPARIVADFASGKVTLMGSLPDADSHDRLLSQARRRYGAANVDDRISVDARVSPAPWLATDALLLPLVDNTIKDGQAVFDGENFLLMGQVPSETIRAQMSERAARAAGAAVKIQNHLQVSR